jgi:hypothetical protein
MPEFVVPTTRVHTSFLKAMAEFQAEGRGDADDRTMVGNEVRTNSASWHRPAAFAEYTNALRAQSLDDAPRPVGHVPCTTLWWVDGDEYLGRLAIRHRLTEWLRNVGGTSAMTSARPPAGRVTPPQCCARLCREHASWASTTCSSPATSTTSRPAKSSRRTAADSKMNVTES